MTRDRSDDSAHLYHGVLNETIRVVVSLRSILCLCSAPFSDSISESDNVISRCSTQSVNLHDSLN